MNIAFDISPLITASGSFGDKSGVYRYTYGLISSLSDLLLKKDKGSKILLFSFNRDLLTCPLNPDILQILTAKNVTFLKKVPKLKSDQSSDAFSDSYVFKPIHTLLKNLFKLNMKSLYNNYISSVRYKKYIKFLLNEFSRYKISIIYHSETGFYPLKDYINVITIYDLTPIISPEMHRYETIDLQRRKIKFASKYCQGIICISKSTKHDLLRNSKIWGNKKITVAYPGLDQVFINSLKKEEDSEGLFHDINLIIKSKSQKIQKNKYLLYYGTFEPRKNLIYLIKAFTDLQNEREIPPDYKLILIGGEGWGGVKTSINNYIDEHFPIDRDKNIILLDYLSDKYVIEFIKNSYCVVYPSLYEGFGLPVLESMSLGKAVICSNNSSLPEVGDRSVLYVDASDYYDIKQKIKYLINNPDIAKSMGLEELEQSKKFRWEKTAIKVYKFITDLSSK